MLWTISRISPLGSLLKLARDSGRVVVLASDHGHVWHRPDARKRPLGRRGAGGVRTARPRPRTGNRRRRGAGSGTGRAATRSSSLVGGGLLRPAAERLPRRGHAAGDGLPAGAPARQEQRLLGAVPLRVPQARMVVVGPGTADGARGASVAVPALAQASSRPCSTTCRGRTSPSRRRSEAGRPAGRGSGSGDCSPPRRTRTRRSWSAATPRRTRWCGVPWRSWTPAAAS